MSYNNKFLKVSHLRREYTQNGLRRHNLPDEPMELFEIWLRQAYEAKIADPTAMVIATVDEYKIPHQRIVLLKHFNKNEFVFYTNLSSHKANHIQNNPHISLLFPWNVLERQITIVGKAERLSKIEEIKYFRSRPINSQISAWISQQSRYIPSRNALENEFFRFKEKIFHNCTIPLPNFWGGFRISIVQIEFWQGRKYRLHDRFLYQMIKGSNKWQIHRLAP